MDMRDELNNIAQALNGAPEVNTKQTAGKDGKTKLKLNIAERPEFDGILKTKLTTTQDLCKEINGLFSQALGDYEGCMIEPDMTNYGAFILKVYFNYRGETNDQDKVKCLEKIGAVQGNSVYDRLNKFNLTQTSKLYTLTDNAKDILEDFIVTNNNKVDWNRVAVEFTDGSVYGAGQRIYTMVQLDIKKVIKKMYGTKLPDGGYADYMISNIRPLSQFTNGGPAASNFLISIAQLDSKQVETICAKIGVIPQNTMGFAIVRS